ncbi:MAG: hypothetical protein JWR70_38, partial [Modestobacter sp.]|nr:hypothetical protein [Modestobacter sp.]
MADDVRVHDELRLAGAPGRWQLDADKGVADVGHRARRSRRRLAGAVAGAVCVLATAVPLVRAGPDTPAPVGASPRTTVRPAPTAARPSTPVLVGPARGSLAGDAAF